MKLNLNFTQKAGLLLVALLGFGQVNAQQTFEAENYTENAYTEINSSVYFSGGQAVSMCAAYGSYVKYLITVETAGTYDFAINYTTMGTRCMYIKAANYLPVIAEFDDYTGSWDGSDGEDEEGTPVAGIKTLTVQVYLNAGQNEIEMGAFDTQTEAFTPNIDKFTVSPSSQSIPVPEECSTPITKEAEDATVISAGIESAACYSGGRGVFSGGMSTEIVFENINVATGGVYDVAVYYTTLENRNLQVKANNYVKSLLECRVTLPYWTCPEDKEGDISDGRPVILKKTTQVYLKAGNNTITISGHLSHMPNVDKIAIEKSGYVMEEPGYETLAYLFDYTDNVVNFKTDIIESQVTDSTNLSRLIDNNEFTTYVVNGTNSVQVTAKLAYPIILTGYGIACSPEKANAVMNDWTVEWSANGTSWNPVAKAQTSDAGSFRKVRTGYVFDNEGTVSAQYYRLTATGEGKVEIGEWQLFGSPYISAEQHFPNDDLTRNVDFENIFSSAMGEPDGFSRDEWGEVFEKVFDKMLNTVYTVVDQKNFYVQFETPDPIMLKSYSLTGRFGFAARDLSKWTLEALNSQGEWTVLDTRENIKFPTEGSTLMFNINEPITSILYKLTAEDTAGDGTINLVQWQMFENWFGINSPANQTGIKDVLVADVAVKIASEDGKIILRSSEDQALPYTVYSVMGQVIGKGICNPGLTTIDVNGGLYIVRVGNSSSKVIVK